MCINLCKKGVLMKKRVNISLDEDTVVEIKKLARLSHMNVSQWITQAVWNDSNKKNKQQRTVKKNG